jgi:hypothetical protein
VAERWTARAVGPPAVTRRTQRGDQAGPVAEAAGAEACRGITSVKLQRDQLGASRRNALPPVNRLVVPRNSQWARRGKREEEPQGCEWVKDPTGPREEQAVRVVRNGRGGTKRVWKPATRNGWNVRNEPRPAQKRERKQLPGFELARPAARRHEPCPDIVWANAEVDAWGHAPGRVGTERKRTSRQRSGPAPDGKTVSGSRLSRLGASKGQEIPQEDGRGRRAVVVHRL